MGDVPSVSNASAAGGWRLEHTYARLPEAFHARVAPTPVAAPRLVVFNRPLAADLGLDADALAGVDGAEIFAGNRLPPGAAPLAQAYSGHQYGHFTTLGDGRAILLGEQRRPDGALADVQLKGAGPTPYSRRGDGRAGLGPMLREYVMSEAMHALGIPTTRSLAVAATGEAIQRQAVAPGAVLVRVAASHLRVGTFEGAAARGDLPALRALVGYALERHFPDRAGAPEPARALLEATGERQAALIAQWMRVGFVHGVMNTDNMAISGETIDYGPCAFVDAYDPATVFSSIDRHGRYAFGNQARVAQWNLARLAEALLPLLHADEATAVGMANEVIQAWPACHEARRLAALRGKLGLAAEEADDKALVERLLAWMQAVKADYTNTFAALANGRRPDAAAAEDGEFDAWFAAWRARTERERVGPDAVTARQRATCPAVIPRNHRMEAVLAAAEQGDLGPLERWLAVLARPYDHTIAGSGEPEDRRPAPDGGAGYRTFCGT